MHSNKRPSRRLYAPVLSLVLVAVVASVSATLAKVEKSQAKTSEDLQRRSIVFDLKTPKVFYCLQEKPADMDKLIVKAQPLDRLCEFDGKAKPKGRPNDCYDDVDETDFACAEKRRFMIKLDLASEYDSAEGIDDLEYILTKKSGKKSLPSGKKVLKQA